MSSSFNYFLLFSLASVCFFSVSEAQFKKPKPTALLFSIRKDTKALQYYTSLEISTPGTYVDVVMDLGGQHTWFNCDAYNLPTYRPILCDTKKCKNAKSDGCMGCNLPRKPGCTNNTCAVSSYNPYTNDLYAQGLGEDALSVDSTNGLSVGISYELPRPFQFSCAHPDLLKSLSNETKGMTGLAKTTTSLHTQLTTQFKLPHKFTICMPSTSDYILGHMFIGGGPYWYPPYRKDIAKELITTPLVINPVSTAPSYRLGEPSDEYFIDVTSIRVDHKLLSIKPSLLSINKKGDGGTKFSTITPFTTLQSSVYKTLVKNFVKAAASRKMKRVASIAPFGACFSSKSIAKSQTGPVVPYIDLVLPNKQQWRFYGANSMVEAQKGVLCLAFVDGGGSRLKPLTSIVVGAHQMENYVIEFDLVSSKLGISTSLLFRNTTCSQSRLM